MKVTLRLGCAVVAYVAAWAAPVALAEDDAKVVIVDAVEQVSGTMLSPDVAAAPTEEQARSAFLAARQSYLAVAEGALPGTAPVQQAGTTPVAGQSKELNGSLLLENVKLVMDVEDTTLRSLLVKVVRQAAEYTGPWTVKWRLSPENVDLLDERVNLTAEAPFGEFCNLLTERVKNMTGTQLYVTAFNSSRVILVTDTYY